MNKKTVLDVLNKQKTKLMELEAKHNKKKVTSGEWMSPWTFETERSDEPSFKKQQPMNSIYNS